MENCADGVFSVWSLLLEDLSLKALHDYWCEGHRVVIIKAGDGRLFGHRYDDG